MDTVNSTAAEAVQDQIEEVSKSVSYFQEHIPDLINFGVKILLAFVALFIGHKIIRFVRKILRKSLKSTNLEDGVISFLDSTIKVLLYAILLFSIATNLGVDTTSVAALVASAGVAVGLALQGSLSNFAGGILILILKPFKVGDFIIEHNNNLSGTVKDIQIFNTRIITVDNKTVVIPNGTLSNGSITNCSQEEERRVDFEVDISYDADLKKAKEIIWNLIRKDPDVIQEHEGNLVFVSELADSSVKLGFRAWCKNEKYWDVKFRLLENVKLEFDEFGIEIPYQQLVVHQAEGKKVAE
ncbi:MAG: mechanosensitive ion channel [Lachnospiraceae bacterium]|nr:mechanosensitive ion channel [Lachnospiraceae bacterium]